MSKVWKFRLKAVSLIAVLGGYVVLPNGMGPAPAFAQTNTVTFPKLVEMVKYTNIQRGEKLEEMFTTPAAIAVLKTSKPLPTGTQLVLVEHVNGKLFRYLVAQKTGEGKDAWKYQSFLPDRSIQKDENPARCFSCHQSRQDQQYMYTLSDAQRFK
nr:cytochrome P460 family protein [uncultured Rhodoferax sp.]